MQCLWCESTTGSQECTAQRRCSSELYLLTPMLYLIIHSRRIESDDPAAPTASGGGGGGGGGGAAASSTGGASSAAAASVPHIPPPRFCIFPPSASSASSTSAGGFFLTRLPGEEPSNHTTTLQELLRLNRLESSVQFNFEYDLPWLIQQYPVAARTLPLTLVHVSNWRSVRRHRAPLHLRLHEPRRRESAGEMGVGKWQQRW